ncbi:MAG TPA: M20/M25/M40 family metallo-hydrolase [Balneolales bacterium]|nr:M20/M25/M40 family metallo-hydrolase [Balneolales bacterium]
MHQVEDLLKKMIQFPTLSGQEKPLVDWLEQYLNGTGLVQLERIENNLMIHVGNGRPWLMLNSHSDVVPPSPDHVGDPFSPIVKDGKMYGRGSTDAKGCGSTMITSLLELANNGFNPDGRVTMALTVCEESAGVNNGMAFLRNHIEDPDAAIVGEPTSLAPCIAQKGMLILKVTTRGESGHAARMKGKNAIYEMGKVLSDLKNIAFDTKNNLIGGVKITPTIIEGGTAKNMAPEKADLYLDIRTIPEVSNQHIIDTLSEKLNASISVVSDRYVATSTDPKHKVVTSALKASGQDGFGSPTSSDWVFLHDIPTVKIGPGHSQVSHTRDEHIEIEQLHKGVKVYQDLITQYFS